MIYCEEAKHCSCFTGLLEPSDSCSFHGWPKVVFCKYCSKIMSKTKKRECKKWKDLKLVKQKN